MRCHQALGIGLRLAFLLCLAAPAWDALAAPPVIEHDPVKIGAQGQSIVIRAKVRKGTHPVKAVTLFYSASKDGGSFKIPMQESGAGFYTGTIPAELLAGLSRVMYYIEARDSEDAAAETPWQTIAIRSSEQAPAVKNAPAAATGTVAAAASEKGHSKWVKPAIIGGVILAGGAVLAAVELSGSHSGGSSSSSSTNSSTSSYAGTYVGTVTVCFQPPGSNSTCSANSATFVIDDNGVVTSGDLRPGQNLQAQLSGANFVMAASVKDPDRTGEIDYVGTIVDTRIVGYVSGTATTASGTGSYSGSFSAVKK